MTVMYFVVLACLSPLIAILALVGIHYLKIYIKDRRKRDGKGDKGV